MNTNYGNVVLVTGASSGIGKAIAELLAKEGFKVYGTSRKQEWSDVESDKTEPNTASGFLKIIPLDVCSEESVKKAVDYVFQREGSLDVLINNAGFGIAGAIEDTSLEEAHRQFDVNFFGVHRMCRTVLPIMRSQKKGLIVNIGSVAGLISIPFQSMYSASKFALEAFTEILRIEAKPFGIKAVLVEPGDTNTGFTSSRQFAAAAGKNAAYADRFEKAINTMVMDEMSGPGPETVAQVVAKIVKSKNPPVRVVVGVKYKVFAFLKRVIPARAVEYIISKIY